MYFQVYTSSLANHKLCLRGGTAIITICHIQFCWPITFAAINYYKTTREPKKNIACLWQISGEWVVVIFSLFCFLKKSHRMSLKNVWEGKCALWDEKKKWTWLKNSFLRVKKSDRAQWARKFKKVQSKKKLMKSNKSISRIIFFD